MLSFFLYLDTYHVPLGHTLTLPLLQYGRENRHIPLVAFDEHWLRLTILENVWDESDFFKTIEMVLLKKLYDESMKDEKKILLRKLKDLVAPYMTSLKKPTLVIPKDRPRALKRKLSQNKKKYAKSKKRDPSGFEYAMTGE